MRKLRRAVSLSVSLLLQSTVMSKAAEKVTGGLGELENRRSGSGPGECNWFVCAHPTLFIDKHVVVFPWQHSLLWQQLALSVQPAGEGEEVMESSALARARAGAEGLDFHGGGIRATSSSRCMRLDRCSQRCWLQRGSCQGRARGCGFALQNVSSS